MKSKVKSVRRLTDFEAPLDVDFSDLKLVFDNLLKEHKRKTIDKISRNYIESISIKQYKHLWDE